MRRNLEAYISREILNIFQDHSLVAVNETLPGNVRVNFHLRDKNGIDVFIEISGSKIARTKLSHVLNLYASISNIEPPLKFELVIVGPEVDKSVKKNLENLPVKLLTFEEIGITQKLKAIEDEQRQLKIRQLSPEEARLVASWETEKKNYSPSFRCPACFKVFAWLRLPSTP